MHLENLLKLDNTIVKPATMSDTAVFISLGDDGGYSQTLLKAYQNIGGAKGIIMREPGVDALDLEKLGTFLPDITDIADVLFDIHDLEDEELLQMKNELSHLKVEGIDSLKENAEAEAENGAALVIASKDIPMTDLWNQEVEFKPYFLYYAIAGLTCLERNGTLIIKIYDTHTEFTKTLIYLLSCNFTSTAIVQPHSINNLSSEKFLVWYGMLHKDLKSAEIVEKLKEIYQSLKIMHQSKSNDLETLLVEDLLKSAGLSIQGISQ